MNAKINVLNGVKEKLIAKKLDKLEELLKPYREEVIAIHNAGLSWEETAEHMNTALNLKAKQRLNARSTSQFAKQWIENNLVDQNIVNSLIAELKGDEKSKEKVLDPTVTYRTIDEFTADVMKSPDQRFHNKEKIEQVFNLSKGRSKKEMLNALREIVLKSMGNV